MDTVDRIKELCKERQMNQQALAIAVGIKEDTVSNWFRRKSASFSKYLLQIAEALDTTTEYLLTGNGPKYRDKLTAVSGAGAALGAAAMVFPPLTALGAAAAAGAAISGAMGSGKSKKLPDTLQSLDPDSLETDFSPDKKEPAPINGDGLSPAKRQLLEAVDDLTDEQCEKLLGIVLEAKRLL